MVDANTLANDVELQAWTVFHVLSLLHAAIDDDQPEGLPVKFMIGHAMHLAQTLPDRIESLVLEARHG